MQEDTSKKQRNEQKIPDSRGLSCYEGESDQIFLSFRSELLMKLIIHIFFRDFNLSVTTRLGLARA